MACLGLLWGLWWVIFFGKKVNMTFDQLMQQERGNAWLQEPGFANLYVRIGLRLIGTEFRRTIDLANFEVAKKGKGVFTKFVARIEQYELPIFVENVLTARFAAFLPSLGFIRVGDMIPSCFLKKSRKVLDKVERM